MKTHLAILFFLLTLLSVNAQNQTNNWFFGSRAALLTKNTNETFLDNSKMIALKGSSSISDNTGELLFYTNGENIWNKNHKTLKNGLRVLGDRNAAQNSIIIPILDNPNKYYLFTSSASLYFSEIDMSKDSGLGEIVSKNNLLIPSGVRGITGVHHKDGKSIWVLVSSSSEKGVKNTSFYAYLIKSNGTIEPPIISKDLFYERKGDGIIKLSPNGKKLAATNLDNDTSGNLVMFNFNSTTGVVSDKSSMIVSKIFFQVVRLYGVEFSNDSNFLYTTAIEEVLFNGDENTDPKSYLYQYDLNRSGPFDQLSIFEDEDLFEPSSLQLSRNGKIYRAMKKKDNSTFNLLGQLKTPHKFKEPNFEINIDLAPSKSELGLPNFIQSYFRTRILEETACAKNPLTFNIDTYAPIQGAIWDFGDGETSSEIIPTHSYKDEGFYKVKANITINGYSVEIEKEIEVYPLPKVESEKKLIQCDNNTGDNRFNLYDIKNQITPSNSDLSFQFFESLDNAENEFEAITNPDNYKNKSNPQKLFTRITNLNNCYEIAEFSIELTSVNLGSINEIFTCGSFNTANSKTEGIFNLEEKRQEIYRQFTLKPTNIITFYKSENDAQTKKDNLGDNYVSETSTIWARVDSEIGCGGIEPINLIVNSEPIINLQDIYKICYTPSLKPPVIISADPTNNRFEWKNNIGTVLSTKKDFILTEIGEFSLTVYKIENGIECSNTNDFKVVNPDEPIFSKITVNTEDENNNIVNVEVYGNSTYEFSLDNINFVDSSTTHTFTKVIPGLKTIYVRDINNCEKPIRQKVSVLGVREFFTPNNDGENDFWNVSGLDANFYKSINIKIFDRLGRVVGSITDFNSSGWDGTFQGKTLISNTYWFKVEIIDIDDNIIKKTGHFSLIRK